MNPDPEKVGRGVCVRVRGCVGVGIVLCADKGHIQMWCNSRWVEMVRVQEGLRHEPPMATRTHIMQINCMQHT
jgi:hypothetical protein